MTGAVKGSKSMGFTYNDEGIRTSKTVNGVTTNYYLEGTRIVGEETSGVITVYIYDSQGSPIGFQVNSSGAWNTYWYEKNLFGDITAVYDCAGSKLISYSYNPWGQCQTTYSSGVTSSHQAAKNPFTYRGYYFDKDLSLHYVSSRYYDPYTFRWISSDIYVSTGQGLTASNMFAYCNNNPVMYVDPTGNLPINIILSKKIIEKISNLSSRIVSFVDTVVNTIKTDISNYDIENSDEQKVLDATLFSAYKGTVVIKLSGEYVFSYGVIVIGMDYWADVNTVKHEYGHKVQLDNMGIFDYTKNVAIPSVTANIAQRIGKLPFDYYSSPWESEADYYGGVTNRSFKDPWTQQDGYHRYLFY
ncbi:MAG: RHS repeat-associated core domain-containing protein [Clostridia bacterium]|nr:RHS repeat-associated core domain-containing protein [Clostridia bacterium]